MKPFTDLVSVAAPLPETDIDTDIIFPARFLLLLDRHGLKAQLFHERRKTAPGAPPFVLDSPPYDRAEILVTGRNFGCGSSREHAVWALADFGVRAIIAPSFGEIFQANCFRNGLLPIALDEEKHRRAMAAAETGAPLAISLETQEIRLPDGGIVAFAIDAGRRLDLLLGHDEIDAIIAGAGEDIARFERERRVSRRWLEISPGKLGDLSNPGQDEL